MIIITIRLLLIILLLIFIIMLLLIIIIVVVVVVVVTRRQVVAHSPRQWYPNRYDRIFHSLLPNVALTPRSLWARRYCRTSHSLIGVSGNAVRFAIWKFRGHSILYVKKKGSIPAGTGLGPHHRWPGDFESSLAFSCNTDKMWAFQLTLGWDHPIDRLANLKIRGHSTLPVTK